MTSLKNKRIVSITSLQARAIGNKSDYILSLIDARHDNYYIGLYDKDYNKITEEFNSTSKVEELKQKYNPLVVDPSKKYNI